MSDNTCHGPEVIEVIDCQPSSPEETIVDERQSVITTDENANLISPSRKRESSVEDDMQPDFTSERACSSNSIDCSTLRITGSAESTVSDSKLPRLAVETAFEFDSSLGSSYSPIVLTPSVNPTLNDTKSSTADASSPTSTDDHDWFDYFDSDDDHALISTPVSSSDNKRTDSCNALLSLSDAVCGTLEPPP